MTTNEENCGVCHSCHTGKPCHSPTKAGENEWGNFHKYAGFEWTVDGEEEWETALRKFWFGQKHAGTLYTEVGQFIRETLRSQQERYIKKVEGLEKKKGWMPLGASEDPYNRGVQDALNILRGEQH